MDFKGWVSYQCGSWHLLTNWIKCINKKEDSIANWIFAVQNKSFFPL